MSKKLTYEQRQVINHSTGHAIVKAVPGSGKSTTLVMRIARLIKSGVPANSILVLMFNKDAANSFKTKFNSVARKENIQQSPLIRTFDSYAKTCVELAENRGDIKRKQLTVSGKGKVIHDGLLKECLQISKQANGNFVDYAELEELTLKFDNWRLNDVEAEDLELGPEYKEIPRSEIKAFKFYSENITSRGVRTFNDQMKEAVSLLIGNPSYRRKLAHIVVDEYQDVNHRQHQFIRCLCEDNTSVMVVGDINQCIYKFRGSNPDFISGIFQREFVNTKEYNLSNTFRFGHQLSYLTNRLTYRNNRNGELCVSHQNAPSTLVSLQNEIALGSVLTRILSANREDRSTGILARTNADLIYPMLCLKLLNIPFKTAENSSKSIKDISVVGFISILLLIGKGDTRLYQIRNLLGSRFMKTFCLSVGLELDEKIMRLFSTDKESETMCFIDLLAHVCPSNDELAKGVIAGLKQIKNAYSESANASLFLSKLDSLNLLDKVGAMSGSRLKSNDEIRSLNVLRDSVFKQQLTVGKLLDVFLSKENAISSNVDIHVMTIHKAKGLEWTNVIIVGLSDERFPSNKGNIKKLDKNTQSDDGSIEEERRLFYVAITRAQKRLYLMHPEDKALDKWVKEGWYSTPRKDVIATRFLFEMDYKYGKYVEARLASSSPNEKIENKLAAFYIGKARKEGKVTNNPI